MPCVLSAPAVKEWHLSSPGGQFEGYLSRSRPGDVGVGGTLNIIIMGDIQTHLIFVKLCEGEMPNKLGN